VSQYIGKTGISQASQQVSHDLSLQVSQEPVTGKSRAVTDAVTDSVTHRKTGFTRQCDAVTLRNPEREGAAKGMAAGQFLAEARNPFNATPAEESEGTNSEEAAVGRI
jgi:hypothetical protein